MSTEIILYDLPSKGSRPHCWSLNPWKARLSLNYKGLAYRTEWTEYPAIAEKFQSYGMAANDREGKYFSYAQYSCPAVKLPDGRYVMDSRRIAEALEQLQPQPSLHMDREAEIDRTQAAVLACQQNLGPIIMPRVPEMLLNAESAEYFSETRAQRFGMPLSELARSDKAGEQAWTNARPHLTELAGILNEDASGPYVLGREVSFADFVVAGFWDFLRQLDRDGDLFARVLEFDASFARQWEACRKWLERDD